MALQDISWRFYRGTWTLLTPLRAIGQVRHSRESGVALQVDSGRFGGARALKMSAARLLPGGAPLAMDFGSDRLDNQILLDYGVLDEEVLQASPCTSGRTAAKAGALL